MFSLFYFADLIFIKIFYPISIVLFFIGLLNMIFYNFTNGLIFTTFSFVLMNFAFGIEQYMHIIFSIKEKDFDDLLK